MTELELLAEISKSLHQIEISIGILIGIKIIWMWLNK